LLEHGLGPAPALANPAAAAGEIATPATGQATSAEAVPSEGPAVESDHA